MRPEEWPAHHAGLQTLRDRWIGIISGIGFGLTLQEHTGNTLRGPERSQVWEKPGESPHLSPVPGRDATAHLPQEQTRATTIKSRPSPPPLDGKSGPSPTATREPAAVLHGDLMVGGGDPSGKGSGLKGSVRHSSCFSNFI